MYKKIDLVKKSKINYLFIPQPPQAGPNICLTREAVGAIFAAKRPQKL